MEKITHEIELTDGTKVVFGKRITASDLIRIDENPMTQNATQYQDLVVAEAIAAFGALKMPVPLSALLDLDSIDREDITEGHNEFQRKSLGDRGAEILSDTKARLAFGFTVSEVDYPMVEFGRRLTGRDEVEADKRGLKPGIARLCFMIGRQISKISTADGANSIDGPIELEMFKSLDGADVWTLRGAAELWRQSFRVRKGSAGKPGAISSDSVA
jgi:hypothetical protein